MPTVLARACEPCRSKKIRCDKAYPCSQCAISNRKCFSILSDQKIKRRRPAQTLEQKIDTLGTRLTSIEMFLRSNTAASTDSGLRGEMCHGFASMSRPSSLESSFCGDVLIHAPSNFAHDYLEKELENKSPTEELPILIEFLRSLRCEIGLHEPLVPPVPCLVFDTTKPITSQITLPSYEFVQKVINLSQDFPIKCFWSVWPGMDLERYVQICRTMYFSLQDETLTGVVLFHGILSALLVEHAPHVRQEESQDWMNCLVQCDRSLDMCMQAIPMAMPRTCDSLNALSILAFHGMEGPDPWAAWASVTSALSISMSLGYHRLKSMQKDTDDEKHQKMVSFWLLYCTEKGLSLHLARSSTVRDCDIALPDPKCLVRDEFSKMLWLWIRLSSIQGRVYDELYSPGSFQSSQAVRTTRAEQLAREMELTESDYHVINNSLGTDIWAHCSMMILSEMATYYSTLSIILRTLTPPKNESALPFSSRCIRAARQALIYHQQCTQMLRKQELVWRSHLHWSFINTPFTPFTIVFCNIIAGSDPSDLQLLEVFIETLKSSIDQFPAVQRMYSLCVILCEAARRSVGVCPEAAGETVHQPPDTTCESVSEDKLLQNIRYEPSHTSVAMNTPTSSDGNAFIVSHPANVINEDGNQHPLRAHSTDMDYDTATCHSDLWQIDQWQEGTQCLSEFLGEDLSFL